MSLEIAASLASLLLASLSLVFSIKRSRKPSLQAAVARAVAYAEQVSKRPEDRLSHAIAAVQREDLVDGRRDWPDATIRFEVEALLQGSRK